MEEIFGQLDEELAVAVPSDVDGPTSIENWYTRDHVAAALLYYAHTRNNARDEDVLSRAQKFYACVVRNNEDYELGGNRKRIKYGKAVADLSKSLLLTMNRITDYLYLTPTGETQQEHAPNTGNDVLNQIVQLIQRTDNKISDLGRESNERFDSLKRESNERFDNMNERFDSFKRESNERFDSLKRESNERFDNMNERFDNQDLKLDHMSRQLTVITARSRNSFQGEGGSVGTSSAYYPLVDDEGKFPEEVGLDPLTSLSQIDSMNSTMIQPYLRFYKLSTTGSIGEKRTRLMKFIGVNHEMTRIFGVKS